MLLWAAEETDGEESNSSSGNSAGGEAAQPADHAADEDNSLVVR